MDTPAVPSVPASALLELEESRDGLLRWVRLRAFRNTLQDTGSQQDPGTVDDIDARLSAILPKAKAHAANLAAFYRTYADAINALVEHAADGVEDRRLRDRLQAAGAGYAALAAERASSIAESDNSAGSGQSAVDDPATNTFCAFLATAQFESDVACISTGDPLECAYGNLVAGLSDMYC
jgi:hypothetical protein